MLDTAQNADSGGVVADVIGEVIVASTTEFTARARLHEPPAYGSFVAVPAYSSNVAKDADADPFAPPALGEGTIYALVYEASTGSIDSNRRPAAYGLAEDELRREQPQIYELLVTDCICLVIGHVRDGRIRAFLPPAPPRIHAQVTACADWEIQGLTERLDYARSLLEASIPATDELIAASIRAGYCARSCDDHFLLRAGKEIATLLHNDYARLDSIIRRITP